MALLCRSCFPVLSVKLSIMNHFPFWQSPIEKWRPSSVQQKVAYLGGGAWNRVFSPGQMRRLFEGGGRLAGGDAYSSKYDN